MVLNAPFVGHGVERDPTDITGHGSVYYVFIGRGEREIVARAMHNGTGHVVYRREENFIRDYGDLFPLGNAVEWEDIDDLLKWIDSIIYYSFLRRSIAGVPRCWFLNRVSCLYTPQALPQGLQLYFPAENITRWIVIRHGNKVWPILVVGRNMLNNSWANFCRVHGLRIGCYVVFACESRWVFNTFMFNENGHEMRYTWSNPPEPLQQLHEAPDDLQTSCLPSLIDQAGPIPKFLCEYTTEMSLHMAFSSLLRNFVDSFHLKAVTFKAGNQTWSIPVMDDCTLNRDSFPQFCADLNLGPFDHVMIAICADNRVRVIVFRTTDGAEQVLD